MAEFVSMASQYYKVMVVEIPVSSADCGPNSHDMPSLEQLATGLKEQNDEGWECLAMRRSVQAVGDHDGRIVRHEMAFQRSQAKRKWLYKIDAMSDPENPLVEQMIQDRIAQNWTLIGFSRFNWEGTSEDALLVWKKPVRRFGS